MTMKPEFDSGAEYAVKRTAGNFAMGRVRFSVLGYGCPGNILRFFFDGTATAENP